MEQLDMEETDYYSSDPEVHSGQNNLIAADSFADIG
jgi:hypothetical protein